MNILIICILLFTFTPKSKANTVGPYKTISQTITSSEKNYNSNSTTTETSSTQGDHVESNQTSTSGDRSLSSESTTVEERISTEISNATTATSDAKTTNITKSMMPSTNTSQSPDLQFGAKGKRNGWTHVSGMILPFITGMIFSSIIFSTVFCTVLICKRCRTTDTKADKEHITLKAVKHDQAIMLSDEDQADEQVPLQAQSFAEVSTNASIINSGTEEDSKTLEEDETQGTGDANEVPYASINFSLLQKKDDKVIKPQNVESDYAEIQLKKLNEEEEVVTLQDGVKQDGINQDGVKQDGVNQDEVKQAEVKQDEIKQDGLEQGINGGLESQKQEE